MFLPEIGIVTILNDDIVLEVHDISGTKTAIKEDIIPSIEKNVPFCMLLILLDFRVVWNYYPSRRKTKNRRIQTFAFGEVHSQHSERDCWSAIIDSIEPISRYFLSVHY